MLPATLVDALGWATRRLSEGGVAGPRREALDLWSELSRIDRAVVVTNPEELVQEGQWRRFKTAVDRRVGGEPLAYTLGRASFRTLELNVDRRVLIPRPETEGLVQLVLDRARRGERTGSAVDIGTGSGCIALSLAVEGRFARVVGTDVSTDALAVAADNVSLVRPGCAVDLQ